MMLQRLSMCLRSHGVFLEGRAQAYQRFRKSSAPFRSPPNRRSCQSRAGSVAGVLEQLHWVSQDERVRRFVFAGRGPNWRRPKGPFGEGPFWGRAKGTHRVHGCDCLAQMVFALFISLGAESSRIRISAGQICYSLMQRVDAYSHLLSLFPFPICKNCQDMAARVKGKSLWPEAQKLDIETSTQHRNLSSWRIVGEIRSDLFRRFEHTPETSLLGAVLPLQRPTG